MRAARHFSAGRLCAIACFAATCLVGSTASADLIEASGGVKGFAGGNLWSAPSDYPGGTGYDGPGFIKSGGGFGWGTGLYVEGRVLKILGLELGLTYDRSSVYRNVTVNNVDFREKFNMTGLRIPVLAKGFAPVPFGRLSLSLGPEFVLAQSADASIAPTSGANVNVITNVSATKKNSTMLTGGVGITIDLPLGIELPLEMRASKNLSQGSAYSDRVSGFNPFKDMFSYDVTAQSSWDFRLSVGLGYKFY
jgi:hypothetical protein